MMALTPIIFASCSKNESESTTTKSSSKVSFDYGVIFDKGLSESGMRQMQVVLSNKNYNFNNENGSVALNDTIVCVIFNSDSDDLVTSGIYTYAETSDSGPFTFGNGSLYLQSDDFSSAPPISSIIGGSINVSNVDSQYFITFQCVLSSGEKFQSKFHGRMSYFDTHQ